MDVPPVRERVLPGVQNVSSMTKKKLLDVATSSFCGGKFRPLSTPSDFSERQIKTLEQIEYLVKSRNNESFLRSNWPDLVEISSRTYQVQFVSVHYHQELLPHILSPLHRSRMDEVFMAPRIREIVAFPGFVDRIQRYVVPFWLVKLRVLLVSLRLLFSRPKEYVLSRQHCYHRNYLLAASQVNAGHEHL